MEYDQNQECEFINECRNACNSIKCNKCEHNPFNYEMMDKYGEGPAHESDTHILFPTPYSIFPTQIKLIL